MKRFLLILTLLSLLTMVGAASAQTDDGSIAVECSDGTSFENGVEVSVVQMRSGFTYTATVLGLNGFDPVLAVLDGSNRGLCTDDTAEIRGFEADLPSTGAIDGQSTNAQIRFDNGGASGFNDVRLVVGGYGNSTGEFLLLLEGMAVTDADGAGDPFSVLISQPMINSGVNVTAYAISVTDQLDPLIYLVDGDYNALEDADGAVVACDDAGNSELCWGESDGLENSFVTRANGDGLGGYQYDAMLSLPLEDMEAGSYFNFVVNSYNNSTYGDYVIAFHIGIGEAGI